MLPFTGAKGDILENGGCGNRRKIPTDGDDSDRLHNRYDRKTFDAALALGGRPALENVVGVGYDNKNGGCGRNYPWDQRFLAAD